MFTNQLLDFAKDELSYRTVVRDLKTNIPMLLIVIVNTNSWSCTGSCLSKQSSAEVVPKLDLHPVVKVLFTEGSSKTESEIRSGDKIQLFCVQFLHSFFYPNFSISFVKLSCIFLQIFCLLMNTNALLGALCFSSMFVIRLLYVHLMSQSYPISFFHEMF